LVFWPLVWIEIRQELGALRGALRDRERPLSLALLSAERLRRLVTVSLACELGLQHSNARFRGVTGLFIAEQAIEARCITAEAKHRRQFGAGSTSQNKPSTSEYSSSRCETSRSTRIYHAPSSLHARRELLAKAVPSCPAPRAKRAPADACG